jgi:hypothetical protein
MKKMSDWVLHVSNGWVVLTGLLLMVVFMIFVLPAQSERSRELLNTASSPDTSFFYTPDELFSIAEEYGSAGRRAYIITRWTFDLIFPLVYVIFLATGISWFYRIIDPARKEWQFLNLLPVFGGIFDYLENITTSLVMATFPGRILVLALSASGITLLKWILIGLGFLVYFLLLFWLVGKKVWSRK